MFAPGNAADLAARIHALLEDPARLARAHAAPRGLGLERSVERLEGA